MWLRVNGPEAVATSLALSVGFVGVLYLVPPRVRKLARNDPEHIRWRMAVLGVYTLLSPLVLLAFAVEESPASTFWDLLWLTARPSLPLALLVPLVHWALLFTGPLAGAALRRCTPKADAQPSVLEFVREAPEQAARDIAVAPFAEELVFRVCIVRLLLSAYPDSETAVICCSPLVFGVAHVHHFFNLRSQGLSAAQAAMQCAFQLLYTSLFGMFVAFVLVRTGSFYAAFLTHAYANYLGVPDMSWTSPESPMHKWSQALWALFVAGVVLFTAAFWGPWWDADVFA